MSAYVLGLLFAVPVSAEDMTTKCNKEDGVACEIPGCADWLEKENDESRAKFMEQYKAQQKENEKGGIIVMRDWWPRQCRELSNDPKKRRKIYW